jgi:hypothetical protein
MTANVEFWRIGTAPDVEQHLEAQQQLYSTKVGNSR